MTHTSNHGIAATGQMDFFTEWNPNPIIQLNLDGEVIYLNLAARGRFPTLMNAGLRHPVIFGLKDKVHHLMQVKGEFVTFYQEVNFLNSVYEEQVFSVAGRDSIFIHITDITAKKRIEAELKRSQELEEKNKLEQERSRIKNEFLTNLSHELRTPLNAILGFSELLHDERLGTLNDEQKDALHKVLLSGKNLLQIISDLLDIANIEFSRLTFNPEHIHLQELTDEVISNFASLIAEKQIHLTFQKDKTLNTAYLDASRFKQVIYNYLSNALKFAPPQGKVQIRLLPETENMFRLEVEDNGPLIKEEDLKELFIEFQQLDSSTTKKHSGIGLGLSITKHLVEAQGGKVGVTSTREKGNTFYAILPLGTTCTK